VGECVGHRRRRRRRRRRRKRREKIRTYANEKT
jgi:hypothetical protein